jgi:hypothetical protein
VEVEAASLLFRVGMLNIVEAWPLMYRRHLLGTRAIQPLVLGKVRKTTCVLNRLSQRLVLHPV